MRLPADHPRAVRCPECGMRTRHLPFVKPACDGYGLVCSRCGRITPPVAAPDGIVQWRRTHAPRL